MMVVLKEPQQADQEMFIAAMQASQSLHTPWVSPPKTAEAFEAYFLRYQQENQKSYWVIEQSSSALVGVFNLNEIIRGVFQNAFLGYYAVSPHQGKGYMSAGLKLVLQKAFGELGLHRLEANIQPENQASIELVRRNGFRLEGLSPRYLKINDIWCDHERWAITAEECSLTK
jgi:RimJ/RimL family protein N-acetyltransferase